MIKKLITIQTELKAAKSQYNSFGKYSYRNAEDILEAVKPLLNEHGLLLTITDKVIEVAGSMFVESTAEVTDGEGRAYVTAQAGLDLNRKGMDKAQSTGASSSYARKYALGGLFLLDDTKDADATNTHGKAPAKAAALPELKLSSEAYLKAIQAVTNKTVTVAQIKGKYTLTGKVLETLISAENSPA
jgi:hypothetical protein